MSESEQDKPDSDEERQRRSTILDSGPFTVFFATIILTAIAVSLLLPVIQVIRGWFR